ncbi:MAG TPA: BrnT family toxin [Patescibacteria group bacterium]|nr:BrnT family toxin [Patescibacteria group bacterium]
MNKRKHSVSFEEGQTVFADDNALFMHDPDHSEDEDRFLLLGLSANARLLVVCHCYREESDTIRIISVWKATKSETSQYIRRRSI